MDKKMLLEWKNTPPHPDIGLTKEGTWLLLDRAHTDEVCIERFTRRFGRAPEYVIPEDWVKFAGPVTKEEAIREQD